MLKNYPDVANGEGSILLWTLIKIIMRRAESNSQRKKP